MDFQLINKSEFKKMYKTLGNELVSTNGSSV